MPPYVETLNIRTKSNLDIVNITGEVSTVLNESKIKDGNLVVFTPHTTAAVTVNEGEPGLKKDILEKMAELVPAGEGYYHDSIDSNAHSHILASIIGCSVSIPVIEGRAALGTWQSILFIELDGPRSRKVIVQVG